MPEHGMPRVTRGFTYSLTYLAGAAVVAALLAACGGSGGGDPPGATSQSASTAAKDPPDPWTSAQAQVSNFGGAATMVQPSVVATNMVCSSQGTCAPGGIRLDENCSAQAVVCGPTGVAVDASGNVYVAAGNAIYRFTPAGAMSVFAGGVSAGYADAQGAAALFDAPQGMAFDASGNLLVADSGNNVIRRITPSGTVSTVAGSSGQGSADGTGTAASFSAPVDVALDPSGNIFVADGGNSAIRRISPAGTVTTLAGGPKTSTFIWPTGVAVDPSGNVIVMDVGANKVLKLTQAGVVTTVAGTGSAGSADGAGSAATFGSTGPYDPLHAAIQYGPAGIVVDKLGYMFVVDRGNNVIRMITPSGVVSTLAGQPGQTWGTANGTGSAARFDTPAHIAMDANANLYVTEDGNSDVRMLTPVQAP